MSYSLQLQGLGGPNPIVDIVFNNLGGANLITGSQKLIQDVLKLIYTTVDRFYPQFSTQIQEIIGTNLGKDATIQALGHQISNALAFIQAQQADQATYQQINAAEYIQKVQSLVVDYKMDLTGEESDATTYTIGITIITGQNQPLTITTDINLSATQTSYMPIVG